ncbi:thioesterase (plasmid) [Rhizobium sp. NIBRBAC000502774]|nr:thioesterase [Rhizobium sp. NIBRBAC000502774]
MLDTLEIGTRHTVSCTVDENMSAVRYGNAGFDVLATPALLGLFEECAIGLLGPYLEAGQGSVGTSARIEHLAATPIGASVSVEAIVEKIDKRAISFQLTARDDRQLIGRCQHDRFVVDLSRFLSRLNQGQ